MQFPFKGRASAPSSTPSAPRSGAGLKSIGHRPYVFAAVTALLVAVGVGAGVSTAPSAQALGKVKCDVKGQPAVAIGKYDPIVNHNGTAAAHEHQFFGNTAWHKLANPNKANYTDLVGKANNCRKVLGLTRSTDSAGYWIPTLRYTKGAKAGQLVPAQQFTAYYRSFDHKDFGAGMAFPADTRLIATKHDWGCGQFSGVPIGPSIPSCVGQSGKPGHTLTAHVDFPSCWDGVRPKHKSTDIGDTNDNAHYRYAVSVKGKKSCPAGFPNKMVELRESFQFAYTGPGNDVALSSDLHHGTTDGVTLHADFWNTWEQAAFETFLKTCVTSKTTAYSVAKCDP